MTIFTIFNQIKKSLLFVIVDILPDNRDTEFDVQMQQSISALQEISTNMAKDVAILYCPDDLPTSENKGKIVDPRQIHKDLVKQKFSW